jgi:hypothetical protein
MKKTVLLLLFVVIVIITISSCNKKYTCAENGMPTEIFYSKDYTPAQMIVLDSDCVHNGGIWEVYNN